MFLPENGYYQSRRDNPLARVRVMNLFRSNDAAPKMLIADDDAYVVRGLAERCRLMGFDVDLKKYGLSALIKVGHVKLDLHMPELNNRWPQLLDPRRTSLHLVVITEHSDLETAKSFETLHVLKGRAFWTKFDRILLHIFSEWAIVTKKRGKDVKVEITKHPRVLVVDDDASVRKFLFIGLRKLGIEPLFAVDGMRGFWAARRHEPAVIVSDYFMPNGDAEYLLARLRSMPTTRNIPVIVQSGRQLSETIQQRLRAEIFGQPGAARILKKSFGSPDLFEALQGFCTNHVGQPSSDGRMIHDQVRI
jgi:CheY-like chemotaxis protein